MTESVPAARTFRLAVVSDLHAYGERQGEAPSYLCAETPDDPRRHPLNGLSKLIKDEELKADVLACCGDLSDGADPAGLRLAWVGVQKIRDDLSAEELVATVGNHDVDSRLLHNKYDPVERLKDLEPPFPFGDSRRWERFWSRHFAIIDLGEARIVALDSSAHHAVVKGDHEKDAEYEHGRVSQSTIESLRRHLQELEPRPINVLICHHHPLPFSNVGASDISAMEGGHLLLDLLGEARFGRWLIVHGHRHQPHLTYGQGGATAPIVLSAGSLSAHLYAELQGRARNQFYLLEFDLDELDRVGLRFGGTFRSWMWTPNKGWDDAQPDSGLLASGGFGCREDPALIAKRLSDHMVATSVQVMSRDEILALIPQIPYCVPSDLRALTEVLETEHGFGVSFDANGLMNEVARP